MRKEHEMGQKSVWMILMAAMAVVGIGCVHAPRPENQIYVISQDTSGVGAALGTGGGSVRDCQEEHEACFRECWRKSRLPYPHKHDEWYYKRCTTDCRKAYNECVDEEEARGEKLEFSRVDQAIEWIRNHKAEVALGTVVIIAGVAFVITTGGSGALVLAPLVLY
jgi:hypothetical protein